MRSARSRIVAITAVAALAVTACGGDEPDPVVTPVPVPTATSEPATPSPTATEAPSATESPTATESPIEDDGEDLSLLYFLAREGGARLWVEPVSFSHDGDDPGVARDALTQLLTAEVPDGLTRPIPDGTELLGVEVVDGTLLIDLSEEMATNPNVGGEGEAVVAQMLAHTGAQFPTVDAVRLLVEGEEVEELWGHLDWSTPIEPDEFAIVPIDVTEATGTDEGTIELAGTSNTFEATMGIVVTDPAGAAVEDTFITASCGTGCRGDWTHTVEGLSPGDHEVTLAADDPSGGEGPPPFSVTLTVTVPG